MKNPTLYPSGLSARLVATLALLAACREAKAQTFISPNRETITSSTEVRDADRSEHLIFVQNRSTVPVIVFSVTLTGCENVRGNCGARKTNILIGPGRRNMVLRIEPKVRNQAFSYHFGYSWHADSSYGTQVLTAMAAAGDTKSRDRLAAKQQADSLQRAGVTLHNELSRDDFAALAGRVVAVRAAPESLQLAPGEEMSMRRIGLLLLDQENKVLGRTQWYSWASSGSGPYELIPPDRIVARNTGQGVMHLRLAEEAQHVLKAELPSIAIPVVVAIKVEPNAPFFSGRVVDADTRQPMTCARIALEDNRQNLVGRARSDAMGIFVIQAPRAGAYRVRVESHGWAPIYGPELSANAGEDNQREYVVAFAEQMLTSSFENRGEYERARPVALSTRVGPRPTTALDQVTLGGSESMPILGIVGPYEAMTTWMQFVVDSAGRVDTASISLPAATPASARRSVKSVLPRVRFAPARDNGRVTCDMMRMQVNFSPR